MKKIILIIIILISFSLAQLFSSGSVKYKLQSLVLPGLGELNMGHTKKAQSFFIREAVLWFTCIGGNNAANWYESDYKAFAEIHANIDMTDKDYIFAVNMGQYDTMEEYNIIKSRQRQVDKRYAVGEGNEWVWDSTQSRAHFNQLRIKSITYEKYASFAIGGLVLHRIISLFDVIYLERKFPKMNLNSEFSTKFGNSQITIYFDL